MKIVRFALIVLVLVSAVFISQCGKMPLNTQESPPLAGEDSAPVQYLAFQIFAVAADSEFARHGFPPLQNGLERTVRDIIRDIGTAGGNNRRLGFIPGPLVFDHTDDDIRQLMRDSFRIAVDNNIAVGFHLDDSMFWGRLSNLNNIDNIEWLDWNKTPNTGRRLDWSSTPIKIMPQLCINSPAVKEEVIKRAVLIGAEARRGMDILKAAHKERLFMGIIAGWETQIGRDYETGRQLGYNALTNKGYSASNPPENIDEARADIVKDFVDFWAESLAAAGVPDDKIFSHIAFMSKTAFDFTKFGQPDQLPGTYLETIHYSPSRVAFGAHRHAGFSTYPQLGHLEQIYAECKNNNAPPWASSEGTAIDPAAAEKGAIGDSMEMYLGNLFNHGTVLVNIFGWGVGSGDNPFRKVAENKKALEAYRKFLRGEKLREGTPLPIPSSQFFPKMQKLQKELPSYLSKYGPKKVGSLYESLNLHLSQQRYADAEKTIDAILVIIEE